MERMDARMKSDRGWEWRSADELTVVYRVVICSFLPRSDDLSLDDLFWGFGRWMRDADEDTIRCVMLGLRSEGHGVYRLASDWNEATHGVRLFSFWETDLLLHNGALVSFDSKHPHYVSLGERIGETGCDKIVGSRSGDWWAWVGNASEVWDDWVGRLKSLYGSDLPSFYFLCGVLMDYFATDSDS